jgi:hypothetical protein
MLKAADLYSGAAILYGRSPTEGDIDQWQGRVRAALPKKYRRRFRFAPLRAGAMTLGNLLVKNALESEQQRRLKESLAELERIMSDIDEEENGRL